MVRADENLGSLSSLVKLLEVDCRGRSDQFTLKKGTYVSDWFKCDSKNDKSKAISAFLSKIGWTGKPCEGDCTDANEDCLPIKLKQSTVDGEADLGIAEVTLFDTKYCQYILFLRKDSEIAMSTNCDCLPKVF